MTTGSQTKAGKQAILPIRWVHGVGACGAVFLQILLWSSEYGFAPRALVGDENRYLHEALLLWKGQAVAPDFIWPPLSARLLAFLVGPFAGNLVFAQILQTGMLVLAAWLLRDLWKRFDPRPLAADLAFWLILTSPAIMSYGFYLWPEPAHLLCLLFALWALVRYPRYSIAAFLAGAAIGTALLLKNLLLAFWPAYGLLLLRWPLRNSYWKQGAFLIAGLLLVTGPFFLQGWKATGRPVIADSYAYNLYVGLQDAWRSDYIQDQGGIFMRQYLDAGTTPAQRNAEFSARTRDWIAEQGGLLAVLAQRVKIQYFRLFNAKRTIVSQLPGAACEGYLGTYTLPQHWVQAVGLATRAHYLLVLVFASLGLVLWKRPGPIYWFVILFFAYQLLLYTGLHVKARFLLPMMPFMAGFAASAGTGILFAGKGVPDSLSNRQIWRWGLGAVLAALLLFFACAGAWLDASCTGVR